MSAFVVMIPILVGICTLPQLAMGVGVVVSIHEF